MKVSVIIPTFNESKVIGECVVSIKNQSYRDLETIVVDDGSTDDTLKSVKNYKQLVILRQRHKGPGLARNLGASKARGKILVFVDSDMTFDKNFITKLIEPILNGSSKGTFSREELVKNIDNIWSQCWGINENWEKGRRHPENYPDKQKVFRAILKSEFDRVGGFSQVGYTDDWTLSEKLGYLSDSTSAVFYHENPDNLVEVFKQAKWIGKRQYRFGKFGNIIVIFRSIFPASIIIGLYKSVLNLKPEFIIFKIVYDLGIFLGSFISLFGGKSAK